MKIFVIGFIIFLSFSCKQKAAQSLPTTDPPVPKTMQSIADRDSSLVASFNTLRNAIYQGDKTGVKKFFDFPIMSEGNEIWSVFGFDDPKYKNAAQSVLIPFDEKDFDKHFDRIFSSGFIKSMLKIKSKELFASGSFETEGASDSLNSVSAYRKMFADYDREKSVLVINHQERFTSEYEDEEFDGESSTVFMFTITPGGELKFKAIHFAG